MNRAISLVKLSLFKIYKVLNSSELLKINCPDLFFAKIRKCTTFAPSNESVWRRKFFYVPNFYINS